jgi:hypothetical protein
LAAVGGYNENKNKTLIKDSDTPQSHDPNIV